MVFYFFYFFLSLVIYFILHFLKFFSSKIYLNLKFQRKTLNQVIKKIYSDDARQKKILLFHAASAGEFEQIKPILKNINRSKYYIIQSFTSSTIYSEEYENKLFDISCYHPYDFIWKSYVFFKSIRPDSYIVSRHDIWPMHILMARLFKVNILYINANIHKNSIWILPIIKTFSKAIFQKIDLCVVPSETIKNNLSLIMAEDKIVILPDTRFSQVYDRYIMNKKTNYFFKNINDSNNIIFGSYDSKDEKIIYNTLLKMYPDGKKSLIKNNHRIILVPHEIDLKLINNLIERLKRNNFSIQLYSTLKNKVIKDNIIIVDCVGILADLYKYASLAYIGGGFTRGVHSVLEPGVHGCAVFYGPNIEMLDELKEINKLDLGMMVYNDKDLLKGLKISLEKIKKQGIALKAFIRNKRNAVNKMLTIIEQNT